MSYFRPQSIKINVSKKCIVNIIRVYVAELQNCHILTYTLTLNHILHLSVYEIF